MSKRGAKLTVSRHEALEKIESRIATGVEIAETPIRSPADLRASRNAYYSWDEYNRTMLGRLFSDDSEAEAYAGHHIGIAVSGLSLDEEAAEHRGDVERALRRLESLKARLDLFDEPERHQESQTELAQTLVETLEEIREKGFSDQDLIQQAIDIQFRLAPTYSRLYGSVPIISTSYPNHIWWSRAREQASQALGPEPATTKSRRVHKHL